jgi:hypothetical protein
VDGRDEFVFFRSMLLVIYCVQSLNFVEFGFCFAKNYAITIQYAFAKIAYVYA